MPASSFRDASVRVLMALVTSEPDPAERKARIMILREDGLLSDREAEDLIRIYGVEAA